MDANDKLITVPLVTGNIANEKALDELSYGVIGQEEAIKKLAFFVQSDSETTPFPTMLFTGSQGLGKSYLATKTTKALGRRFVEVNCGTIQKAKQFIEEILLGRVLGETPVTLFLDEAHKLSSEIAVLLLSFLNPTSEYKNRVAYRNWIIEYDFSKINVIFATTDAYKIPKPLRNRCEEIYFHSYSEQELFDILKFYLGDIKIGCADWKGIATACRGRARDAFLLAENMKRYCSMEKTNMLTKVGWEKIKHIFGIYPNGLNDQEVDLLRILADNSPISCLNIAVRMGVNERNVEEEIEIRPKEIGFVRNTPQGRILTVEGVQYLQGIGISA